jgi:hypothetical protein
MKSHTILHVKMALKATYEKSSTPNTVRLIVGFRGGGGIGGGMAF